MQSKKVLTGFGFFLSFVFLAALLWKIEWTVLYNTIKTVNLWLVLLAACGSIISILSRSARWNIIAGLSLRHLWSFWRAASIGYVGNLIYPAKAGEALRMLAIHRFANLSAGRAVISTLIDRLADVGVTGLFLCLLIASRSCMALNTDISYWTAGIFLLLSCGACLFIRWGDHWQSFLAAICPRPFRQSLLHWYTQTFEGAQPLRDPLRLLATIGCTFFIFALDASATWLVIKAFGWPLPLAAGFLVYIFLSAGTALPSSPGSIGIYQWACVLALRVYHIDDTQAVAFSLVLQLLNILVVLIQGGVIAAESGTRTLSMRQS